MLSRNAACRSLIACIALVPAEPACVQHPAGTAGAEQVGSNMRGSSDAVSSGTSVLPRRNQLHRLHSPDSRELHIPFTPEFNQTVTTEPGACATLGGVDNIEETRSAATGETIPVFRARNQQLDQKTVLQQNMLLAAKTDEDNYLLYLRLRVALAFAADRWDVSFRTPQEVHFFLGLPVLAAFPKDGH